MNHVILKSVDMAENKKSIVVYADWLKKFETLNDDEAGRLIKHFFRYVNDLRPIAPDRITEIAFIDIEASLKRDLVKWELRADRSRENGKGGGRPPKEPTKPIETQQVILKPRKPDSVNVSVNVSVNDIENLINNKIQEVLNSDRWLTDVAKNQKWPLSKLKIELSRWLEEQKLKEEIENREIKEIRNHFINWIKGIEIPKLEIQSNRPPKYKPGM